MTFAELLESGTLKLENEGFLLDFCIESDLELVEDLTRCERNALKMMIRRNAVIKGLMFMFLLNPECI